MTRTCSRPGGRRATIYLTVLFSATLVTIIGVSAVLAVRSEHYAAGLTEEAVKADLAAQTAVDVALYRVADNPAWRTAYTHDTWTPAEIDGDVSFRFKLIDDVDADLADDMRDPVRLLAQATVGDAMRMYSVELVPTGGSTNLLANGNMENGLADWVPQSCDLESHSDEPYEGSGYVWVKNRVNLYAGPSQDVTGSIESGATYRVEFCSKMLNFSEHAYVALYVGTTSGNYYFPEPTATVGTAWTGVSATVTPSFSGDVVTAALRIETDWSNQDFKLDAVVLVEEGSGPPVKTVPGTWRRDVLP